MLIVIIDLLPGGNPERRRTIGSLRIANVTDLADVSDYRVEVLEAANPLASSPDRIGSCEVLGHDRRQVVWALLAKAAEAAMTAEFDDL